MSTSWAVLADHAAELDRIAERLDPTPRKTFTELRALLESSSSAPVGEILETLYPASISPASRQRSLQRLAIAINEAAKVAQSSLELVTVGAKQLGDRRLVGFIVRRRLEAGARADLAESHGLQSLGSRRAEDVSSAKPPVRVLLWSHDQDNKLAEKLWELLKECAATSGEFHFIFKDMAGNVLTGQVESAAQAALLKWADLVVLAVSPRLLAFLNAEPDLLVNHLTDDCTVPVLLRPLGRSVDLGSLQGRRFWSPVADQSGQPQPFSSLSTAHRREEYAQGLGDELHKVARREWAQRSELPNPVADLVTWDAHGEMADLLRVSSRRIRGRQGHRGFQDQAGARPADIVDVDDHLKGWACSKDGKSLLALLGDSGIGKTIAAQRLASDLWKLPGGPAAHYFDLRDISGIRSWQRMPPVQDILALCVAGGWVEAGRPISLTRAEAIVDEILEDTKTWGTVLIIDGLDEVLVHIERGEGRKFTNQLLRLRPVGEDPIVGERTKLMLTCRTHYFTDVTDQIGHFLDQTRGPIREDDYEALSLLPVTRDQIAEYLSEALGWPQAEVERFLSSIHDLWDLASRPYLLSQLAEVLPDLAAQRERGVTTNAASVYQALTEKWLVRDKDKHELAREDKPLAMAYIAYRLWTSRSRIADIRTVKGWLADFIQSEGLQFQYAGKAPTYSQTTSTPPRSWFDKTRPGKEPSDSPIPRWPSTSSQPGSATASKVMTQTVGQCRHQAERPSNFWVNSSKPTRTETNSSKP